MGIIETVKIENNQLNPSERAPLDWSPVCGDQLGLYNELIPEFKNNNMTILGIFVDRQKQNIYLDQQK
jgi:peroxiredoxin